MPEVVIRQVQTEEMLELASPLRAYAFSSTPPLPEREKSMRRLPYERGDTHFILFEDKKPVACVSSQRLTQQVRGKIYMCGGVRGVATHPAARLKGYSWLLLNNLFETFHTTSIPFSTLYPFRESFYERLGYTTFPQPRIAHLETAALLPLLKKKLAGNVELLSIAEGYKIYRAYLYKQQQKRHGMAFFSENFASSLQNENTVWLACAKDENGLECGMMLYYIQEYLGSIIVSDFCYDTSLGRSLLLEWLARHMDQMKKIEITLPPYEYPETWFSDMNVALSAVRVTPMGRIIDIQEMSGIHSGPGSFSAQIYDKQCSWNNNCYQFETRDGVLHVSKANTADCNLTIQALSALIYGTNDPDDFAIRNWGNPLPQFQQIMRTMFPPLLPYLHEIF